jgi:hypothetical protein
MKNVQKLSLLPSNSLSIRGVSKMLAVLATIALFALTPLAAKAKDTVSQLSALQWLVRLSGDEKLFSGHSTSQDYIQWAKSKGMNPTGGWKPTVTLTKNVLAQILVQFMNLNPKKGGGDYVRILAREGINLPDEDQISRESFSHTVGDLSFGRGIPEREKHHGSKHKPPKGHHDEDDDNGEKEDHDRDDRGHGHDNHDDKGGKGGRD